MKIPRTNVAVPASLLASLPAGREAASVAAIVLNQLRGCQEWPSPIALAGWEKILEVNLAQPPQRGAAKSRRQGFKRDHPAAAEPPSPIPEVGQDLGLERPQLPGLASLHAVLAQNRAIVNPLTVQHDPTPFDTKTLPLTRVLFQVRTPLESAQDLMAGAANATPYDLTLGREAATQLLAAVLDHRIPQASIIKAAARYFSMAGLVLDFTPAPHAPAANPAEKRVTLPKSEPLRHLLVTASNHTGLSLDTVGRLALLAHLHQWPLADLFRRHVERRVLLKLASELTSLQFQVGHYVSRLEPQLTSLKDECASESWSRRLQNLEQLRTEFKVLLQDVAAFLTGRAETNLAGLADRSRELQRFGTAAMHPPNHISRTDLEAAAGMIQRLWGETGDYTSVFQKIRRAQWKTLTQAPFQA